MMSFKVKKVYRILFFVFIFIVLFLIGYFILINSAWYHWRAINKFKDDPKSYGDLGEGSEIYYHFHKLIAKGEMEYSRIFIKKSLPSSEIIKEIKEKYPNLVWIRIYPYEFTISNKSSKYILQVWTKKGDMILLKDYINRKGWNIRSKYSAKPKSN